MAVIAMKQLLEAGVHFGHQTRRWDPKMAEYIFQARNGIHIIDLQKTSKKLDEAYEFLKTQAAEGKTVLFVGTKKQASECIKEAAQRCSMYYVDQRWLGGMLTNFDTIKSRVERLRKLEAMQEDGTFDVLPKKEVAKLKNEMEKLEKNLGGIKEMEKVPGVLFIVDPKKERIAILEARKLAIPVIGLIDTNCNPDDLDYPIPGNDDAIRAVKLIADVMANAVIEGREGVQISMNVEEGAEQKDETVEIPAVEEVAEIREQAEEVAEAVKEETENVGAGLVPDQAKEEKIEDKKEEPKDVGAGLVPDQAKEEKNEDKKEEPKDVEAGLVPDQTKKEKPKKEAKPKATKATKTAKAEKETKAEKPAKAAKTAKTTKKTKKEA